jgi:hypothetical protein
MFMIGKNMVNWNASHKDAGRIKLRPFVDIC